ncbi:MAG: hypothetical protein WCJ14_01120 [Verrucomicrobiota bacterium]
MKASGILRAVRAVRFDRAVGDAPSLGHVERAWGTGTSKRRRRQKSGATGRKMRGRRRWRRKVVMMWSLVLALLGMATIVGALWLWGSDEVEQSAATAEQQAAVPVIEERVVSRFESPTREAALALVKRALLIRDPAQVAECFRLGSASPQEVVGFLQNLENVDGAITSYVWLSSMDANGLLLDGVAVKSVIGDKPRHRLAILTPDAKGKWQIDFEALARTLKPAWSELLASPVGGQGLVRVVFAKDNYYNGPFRDEEVWVCYRLGSAELADDLLGYCRKGSPQAAAMVRMLVHDKPAAKGGTANRAVLEIRRVAGAESRQFEIVRVLAEDWVLSATPFDQPRK